MPSLLLRVVVFHLWVLVELVGSSVSASTAFTAGGAGGQWTYGGSYPPINDAKVGDTLTFSFSSPHNVHSFPSLTAFTNCDFSGATLLASSGPYTYTLTENSLPAYFGCSVDSHCSQGGMKIQVNPPSASGTGAAGSSSTAAGGSSAVASSTGTEAASSTASQPSGTSSSSGSSSQHVAYTAGGPNGQWEFGGSYPTITNAVVGDTVTFHFTSGHTVELFPSLAAYEHCDFASATLLASSGPFTYTLTSLPAYFGCSIPGHCAAGGMKLAITNANTGPNAAVAHSAFLWSILVGTIAAGVFLQAVLWSPRIWE